MDGLVLPQKVEEVFTNNPQFYFSNLNKETCVIICNSLSNSHCLGQNGLTPSILQCGDQCACVVNSFLNSSSGSSPEWRELIIRENVKSEILLDVNSQLPIKEQFLGCSWDGDGSLDKSGNGDKQ